MTGHATSAGPPLLFRLVVVVLLIWQLPVATGVAGQRDAECAPSLPVTDRDARDLLANDRPFAPDDLELFHSWDHPDWEDVPLPDSPKGPALDEAEIRADLSDFLTKRFPCSPEDVRAGLAVYGDPVARHKLPDPTLRAALAALVGTLGEPAILHLLYEAPVTSIHFGVSFLPEEDGASLRHAATWISLDGTQQIVVDRKDRFVHFGAFSALLFHEALHVSTDGEGAGEVEEVIALSLEALVYMDMLLTDPSIAQGDDWLTRSLNNHTALLRLNSGPAGSDRMTLFVPDSEVTIDPTAVEPITQFADLYNLIGGREDVDYAGRETPGNPLLQTVLNDLAESGESPPRDANFDVKTLDFLDRNHATLTAAEVIAVACILQLDIPCD